MSRRSALIVGLALVLVFAACGTDDTTQPSTTQPATTATTTTTTTTTSTTATPTTSSTTTTTTTSTTTEPPDVTPPQLVITAPQPGETVTTRTYRFAGTTEPGCTVTAAGRYAADVDAEGNWSIVLVLNEGGNLATLVAADEAGNTTTAKIAVTYQPPPQADGTVLVANEQGVYQIDPDGEVTTLIDGEVASAVDDTRGGLLFQTHKGRNWNDEDNWSTVIWWVPTGGSSPSALLVPTPGTDHELTLYDTYETAAGFAALYVRHEGHTPDVDMIERLRRFEYPARTVTDIYASSAFEAGFGEVSTNEEWIAGTWYQQVGSGCFVVDLSGRDLGVVPIEASDRTSDDYVHGCVLSPNSELLTFVTDEYDSNIHVSSTVHLWNLTTDTEAARFVIDAEAGWVQGVDMSARSMLVSVSAGPALLFEIDNPDAAPSQLPIAGRARFVDEQIEIAGPLAVATAVLELRSDGLRVAAFSDPADVVTSRLTSILGPPSAGGL